MSICSEQLLVRQWQSRISMANNPLHSGSFQTMILSRLSSRPASLMRPSARSVFEFGCS